MSDQQQQKPAFTPSPFGVTAAPNQQPINAFDFMTPSQPKNNTNLFEMNPPA
jgi:hypothetical protein